MMALKYVDRIDMYIVDGVALEERDRSGTLGNLLTRGGAKSGPKFAVKRLIALNDPTLVRKFTIELTDIDGRIKNLGDSLKQSLKELYDELSRFQYNVETIITGVNEKGKVVRDQYEFDVYHLSAEKNIINLSHHLKRLVSDINK
jgi:aspartate/tyrosine/aromatic aminotransferase